MSALGRGELGLELGLPLSIDALRPPKLDKSICREYRLLDGGVGIALLLPEWSGLGDPVDGVYKVSSPPKESCDT